MKALVLVSFAVFSFATILVAQTPATVPEPVWNTFNYPDDGFSVSFPFEPNMEKHDVQIGTSTVEMHSYIALLDSGALFVGFGDLIGNSSASDPAVLLQTVKDLMLFNAHAHVLRERPVKLDTYTGLEFEAESEQMHYSARFYEVGTTVYQTLVESKPGVKFPDEMRFLDSFRVIPRVSK